MERDDKFLESRVAKEKKKVKATKVAVKNKSEVDNKKKLFEFCALSLFLYRAFSFPR